jgi:thioredoxin:protein disulfide reductase
LWLVAASATRYKLHLKLKGNLMRFLLLLVVLLAPFAHAEGFFDRLPTMGGEKQKTFLPPDQAFGLELETREEGHKLLASFRVTPSYYLYRDKVQFEVKNGAAKIGKVSLPAGEIKVDPNFGEMHVFHQSFQAEIELQANKSKASSLIIEATYQGCSENGLCYPPINKTFTLMLPTAGKKSAAPALEIETKSLETPTPDTPVLTNPPNVAPSSNESESGKIAQLLKGGNLWLIVLAFFGAGLLLAFTPCMLPMVPILSGIIVGRGKEVTRRHAFWLSLAYVLGMALTYAAAGVAAGLSGSLLSSALQTPWVLGSFAAMFVVLSLSMFGFYELQLPSVLQNKLSSTSNQLHGGHLGGVFVMGALSAIIVSPCVAAPLAGALLYIGQTHDAWLGGIALFSLAMGMGLPLLLIGTSAGVLLPKAGGWMESVKRFFGVLLLALAIWIISPLLPFSMQMGLWGVLLVFCAVYLNALDPLPYTASGWRKLSKSVAIISMLLGVAYLVGALSGARNILRPLGALGGMQVEEARSLKFARVKNIAELEANIAQAKGRPVMLDFYADWCVSCKEMEHNTFSDARVQAQLAHAVLLQADVTNNNEDDKALLKRYSLFGPPAILFFDAQGREMGDARVTGYQNAEQFLGGLSAVMRASNSN